MTVEIGLEDGGFVFERKPKPVPGDLRIAWRLAVTLLVLLRSRGQRASIAKLHMLNDALRSETSRAKLKDIIAGRTPGVHWRMRVEPAFSRNLDFMVGEGFANWTVMSGRTGLALTNKGKEAGKLVESQRDLLIIEGEFINNTCNKVTETFVQSIVSAGSQLL